MNIIKVGEQLQTNVAQNYRITYFVTLCSFPWEQNNTWDSYLLGALQHGENKK